MCSLFFFLLINTLTVIQPIHNQNKFLEVMTQLQNLFKTIAPPRDPLRGCDTAPFAFYTISKRMPIIVTKAIDYVCRLQYQQKDFSNATAIIASLQRLKYEMQHDNKFSPIAANPEDKDDDAFIWNQYIQEFENSGTGTWFQATWLFSECYMYRRMREAIVHLSPESVFDPFREQKEVSLIFIGLD